MPSATFSHAVAVVGPPADVWNAMQPAAVWVGVGPIERVFDERRGDDGRLIGYRWEAEVAGRRWTGTARTAGCDPGRLMSLHLDSSQMETTVTARLSPDGEGTSIRIDVAVSTRGMLAGLFWGVIRQAIGDSLPEQAAAFAGRLGTARNGPKAPRPDDR